MDWPVFDLLERSRRQGQGQAFPSCAHAHLSHNNWSRGQSPVEQKQKVTHVYPVALGQDEQNLHHIRYNAT